MEAETAGGDGRAAAGASVPASGLVGSPVRWRGIRLGSVAGVLFESAGTAVGFEVRCPDGRSRFLPLSACERFGEDEVLASSALALLDSEALEYYRERTVALASLLRRGVEAEPPGPATLAEIWIGRDGRITAATLAALDGSRSTVPAGIFELDEERRVVRVADRANRVSGRV